MQIYKGRIRKEVKQDASPSSEFPLFITHLGVKLNLYANRRWFIVTCASSIYGEG